MKKLVKLLLSSILALGLVACSSNETTSKDSVKYYLENYEELDYCQADKGWVYVLDDGTENGMALAVVLSDDQFKRISELDFFSDSYYEDIKKIVEESNEYKISELDDYAPNMSDYDKYVGQKIEVLMNDGYSVMGHNISDNYTGIYLDNDYYSFEVEVEEKVEISKAENLTDDDYKNFTIKSVNFFSFTGEFFNTLY